MLAPRAEAVRAATRAWQLERGNPRKRIKVLGPLQTGQACVLCIGNQFFDTEVLAVHEKAVRVRRPDQSLPIQTAAALLAFHDEFGLCSYYTQLMPMPDDTTPDLILWRTASLERQELRSVLRVPADSKVTLRDEGADEDYEGVLENISGGGARIIISRPIVTGTEVFIAMHLPGSEGVQARGRIAHVLPQPDSELVTLGVKFTEMRPEDMNAVRLYITSRIQDLLPGTQ
jgi:hypothetical protein